MSSVHHVHESLRQRLWEYLHTFQNIWAHALYRPITHADCTSENTSAYADIQRRRTRTRAGHNLTINLTREFLVWLSQIRDLKQFLTLWTDSLTINELENSTETRRANLGKGSGLKWCHIVAFGRNKDRNLHWICKQRSLFSSFCEH